MIRATVVSASLVVVACTSSGTSPAARPAPAPPAAATAAPAPPAADDDGEAAADVECDGGHACFVLARRVRNGRNGEDQDYGRAQVLLTEACKRDYAAACYTIALLGAGDGGAPTVCPVADCRARARELWAAACASDAAGEGSMRGAYACQGLGELVFTFDRHWNAAATFLRRGCELGSGRACDILADEREERGDLPAAGQLRARAEQLGLEAEEIWQI